MKDECSSFPNSELTLHVVILHVVSSVVCLFLKRVILLKFR